MKYQIVQIMAAPAGMSVIYHDGHGPAKLLLVACLALIEDADGFRSVEPMIMMDANIVIARNVLDDYYIDIRDW